MKGEGHFSSVRLARLIGSREQVFAVKTINKKKIKKESQLLKRELTILKNLDHPNIVKFYEVYQDENFFHLVTEFCGGGDLVDRLIEKKRFTEEETRMIMRKAFQTVHYLHKHGVVHRDLKLNNFLFSHRGDDAELKLIDFGLARYAEKENLPLHSSVGTPMYVAPEVVKGKYDEKCDSWSLGVMMYILLCGNPPFEDDSNQRIFKKIMRGKYNKSGSVWNTLSKSAKDLISKLLAVNSSKRYTPQKALKHPWILEQQPSREFNTKSVSKILSNLRNCDLKYKFQKEVMTVIASYLNPEQLKKIRNAFDYCVQDGSDEITSSELSKAFKSLGFQDIDDEKIKSLLEKVSLRKGAVIRYSEFIAASMDYKFYSKQEILWTAFKYFDIDDTKYITLANLREVMARRGRKLEDSEIDQMIQEVDFNNQGKLSFGDFCEMLGVNSRKSSQSTVIVANEKDDLVTQIPNFRSQSIQTYLSLQSGQ